MRTGLPLLICCVLCSCSSTTPVPLPAADEPPIVDTDDVPARPLVAVTIDDLPFLGEVGPGDSVSAATDRMLAALRKHQAPATGFVVCHRVKEGAPLLNRWLKAGLELGNHSSTHQHIDRMDLDAWERDVGQCKARIEEIAGRPARWFRYPFLQRGATPGLRDEGAARLARLGQEVATVSVDTGEWVLARPYVEALKAGDRARAIHLTAWWSIYRDGACSSAAASSSRARGWATGPTRTSKGGRGRSRRCASSRWTTWCRGMESAAIRGCSSIPWGC